MNRLAEKARIESFLPKATVKQGGRSWALWLVPLGAVALCVWFAYRDFISTGPAITIYFENADGLETKNTLLKFRGAKVGEVKAISLTKDGQHVEVKARMSGGAARNLARAGSVFWIVRPEVSVGAVSGLQTIVTGEYIAMLPGKGPPTNVYFGVAEEPTPVEPRALLITLLASGIGSLQERSPVFYRGVQVGEVLGFQLGEDARNVVIHARVWEEYAPLVRPESEFWNAGGFELRVGLFKGFEMNARSPKTIISGAVEFATPLEFQDPATNGATFVLNDKPEDKWRSWNPAINLHLTGQAAQTNDVPGFLKQAGLTNF